MRWRRGRESLRSAKHASDLVAVRHQPEEETGRWKEHVGQVGVLALKKHLHKLDCSQLLRRPLCWLSQMLSTWEGGFICHVRICCSTSYWLFQGTSQIVLSTFWGLRGSWHELSIRGDFEGGYSSVDYLLEALSSLSSHLEDTSWGDHNWWTAHHAEDDCQEQVACVRVVTGIWSWSH